MARALREDLGGRVGASTDPPWHLEACEIHPQPEGHPEPGSPTRNPAKGHRKRIITSIFHPFSIFVHRFS